MNQGANLIGSEATAQGRLGTVGEDAPIEVIIDLRTGVGVAQADSVKTAKSFSVVIAIYAVAIAAAVATVLVMQSPLWLEVLVADVVATAITFVGSFMVKNSSMYDAYWSVAPAVAAVGMAVTGGGLGSRKIIVTFVVLAWAIRLTANWAYGWAGMKHEDWRYVKLQQDTGKLYWLVSFLGVHFFPTAMVFAGMLPLFVAYRSELLLGPLDLLGVLIGVAAVALEGIADAQMHRFRRSNTENTRVMETGLWSRSRHPNYLGEILFWVSLACFGLSAAPSQWWRLAGVVTMVALFVFISIPMIEKRHLQRKGAAFAAYQSRVPMLVPGTKRFRAD
jgi:steroid 5-alpha reductase family enzyme